MKSRRWLSPQRALRSDPWTILISQHAPHLHRHIYHNDTENLLAQAHYTLINNLVNHSSCREKINFLAVVHFNQLLRTLLFVLHSRICCIFSIIVKKVMRQILFCFILPGSAFRLLFPKPNVNLPYKKNRKQKKFAVEKVI